jgi:hypothetical protein
MQSVPRMIESQHTEVTAHRSHSTQKSQHTEVTAHRSHSTQKSQHSSAVAADTDTRTYREGVFDRALQAP